MISHHWSQHWHRISTSRRLLIIGMSSVATFFLLPSGLSIPVCVAISWVVSGCIYLFLTYMMMYFSREENILTLSKKEDAGAAIILLITILAATASLVAIVIILSSVRLLSATDAFWQIAIVLSTYTVSWLVVHCFCIALRPRLLHRVWNNQKCSFAFCSKAEAALYRFSVFFNGNWHDLPNRWCQYRELQNAILGNDSGYDGIYFQCIATSAGHQPHLWGSGVALNAFYFFSQRAIAASSVMRASTHRPPSGVSSFFQNGAAVFR